MRTRRQSVARSIAVRPIRESTSIGNWCCRFPIAHAPTVSRNLPAPLQPFPHTTTKNFHKLASSSHEVMEVLRPASAARRQLLGQASPTNLAPSDGSANRITLCSSNARSMLAAVLAEGPAGKPLGKAIFRYRTLHVGTATRRARKLRRRRPLAPEAGPFCISFSSIRSAAGRRSRVSSFSSSFSLFT